jgi:hypothetical protein
VSPRGFQLSSDTSDRICCCYFWRRDDALLGIERCAERPFDRDPTVSQTPGPLPMTSTGDPNRGGHRGLHAPSGLHGPPSLVRSGRSEDGSSMRPHREASATLLVSIDTSRCPRPNNPLSKHSRDLAYVPGPRIAAVVEFDRYKCPLEQMPEP